VLTRAVTIAVFLFYCAMFFYNRLEGIPRSVPAIHWLVLLAMLGAPRFAYRILKDHIVGLNFTLRPESRIPVLLIGANENAEFFIRETKRNPRSLYRPVAIAEDNPRFDGQHMLEVEIHSGLDRLSQLLGQLTRRGLRPQRIVVADDSLDGERMRALLEIANRENIPLARLPRLTEFKAGIADAQEIRPVAVEDLLGRAQTVHDTRAMQELVQGKRVLVTGAGGSIGSELVRQIAGFQPESLILADHAEYNLYRIDRELADTVPSLRRHALLADVRDRANIERIFDEFTPQIVFHAAAIKHVPLAEGNPEEAILTNVFGTKHIADACVRHKVAAMVLISTDKAVNPANVMGATKRLAESYCQSLGEDEKARGQTRFVTVRFGNVLGSTGSVVPLFQKQLKQGGPITVTHPDMVRYFMTIREAVALVLQAAALGAQPEQTHNGLIFVVDMGQPVRIEELALQMIRLAGLEPNVDVHIVYSGLRPGEKLYEELFHPSESPVPTSQQGILLACTRKVDFRRLEKSLAELESFCQKRRPQLAVEKLKSLVPEFILPS
ncbi:MAG: polysaccharide biosynthesis protein, partial [Alphaproteobacteria bacterium]|nr:polysaccharide biosynthesis protein [Alphaproteobacteria bacterium]